MKKTILLFALISCIAFIPADKTLTQQERDYAVQMMEQSKTTLLNDVKGLTPEQLNWKADSTRWSVAQCVEHIAVSEGTLIMLVRMALSAPPNPDKRDSIKVTDAQLVAGVQDRSHKYKAPDMLKPDGKFVSYQAALDSFVVRRNRNIEFIKTTNDDFRDHVFQQPGLGWIDDYQALLLMIAHSKRHTLQLEEVKNSAGFPK